MTDSFSITLPSNSSLDLFPDNTLGNYKVKLHRTISLPPSENWQVALSEISLPKSWFNLTTDLEFGIEVGGSVRTSDHSIIKAGYYETINEILDYMNNALKLFSGLSTPPSLTLNKQQLSVTITAGKTTSKDSVYLFLVPELKDILGINFEHLPKDIDGAAIPVPVFHSELSVKLNSGFRNLFIYTDIISPTPVGNSYTKLLRILPVKSSTPFSEQLTVFFERPLYHKLLKTELDIIELDIKTDFGETVQFNFGKIVATLLFRKVDN